MNPNMPTGETMEEGDYSGAETPEQETVTLTSDQLGSVAAKKGDKIRFCVTDTDEENGQVFGYFETGDEAPEEKEESWEEGALKIGKNNSMKGRI